MYRPRSFQNTCTELDTATLQLALQHRNSDTPQQGYQSPAQAKSSSRSSPAADEQTKSRLNVSTDYYSGAKAEVPMYKRMKGLCIWLTHKLVSCITSEHFGQAILSGVLLLMVAGMWLLYAHMLRKASESRHMVVLDAGSTGTRVHILEYTVDPRSSYAVLKLPEPKYKVNPGLSSYAKDAAGAGASLQPLLEFAQQHVPAKQQQATPVYLMATAGLRLLPPAAAESILQQCRNTLLSSAFLFKPEWASIISGTTEGVYAWVAANFVAGHLQAAARNMRSRKEPRQPRSSFNALIEMGGASAQVTFMPDVQWHSSSSSNSNRQESLLLSLPGVTRPLWSHSYLGYGFDVVEQQVDLLVKQQAAVLGQAAAGSHTPAATQIGQPVKQQQQQQQQQVQGSSGGQQSSQPLTRVQAALMDPCLPAGYTSGDGRTGSGEWQQCQQLVARVINPKNCKAAAEAPCPEIPAHMPQLTGQLLAIENFAYTAHALELPEVSSIGDFALAARRFCSKPWPQTLQAHSKEPHKQQYLWRYCFGSAFAWTLLHDVLHLGEGQILHFTNTLKSSEGQDVGLNWAVGAAVLQLSGGASSREGVLVRQQQLVITCVLIASITTTAALLVAAALAIARWLTGRERAKQQAAAAGFDVGAGGAWEYDARAAGRGAPALYTALPVSTRVIEGCPQL